MNIGLRHSDVFVRAPGGGNPCPVVLDAEGLTADQMRSIAAHYGHESGFAFSTDGEWRFRFFVPNHEMSMCVHATIALVSALLDSGRLDGTSTTVHTESGPVSVSWDTSRPPQVTVEQQPPRIGDAAGAGDRAELAAACGLPADALDPDRVVRPASVSRPKLIVALRTDADVQAAAPDGPRLWDICRRLDTTGAYLFAPTDRAGVVIARQFPVDAGYPEDPATGVAAGALAAYLATETGTPGWHPVEIEQGDAMRRPSRLRAAAFVDDDGVVRRSTVTGTAILGPLATLTR